MAALRSTRHHPLPGTYHKGPRAKGKPARADLTAVMRKLPIDLNSLLKTSTDELS